VDRAVERDLSEALPAGTDSSRLLRFDAVERGVHWLTAALVLTLVVTGAILYVPSLERLVGEREIVKKEGGRIKKGKKKEDRSNKR